MKSMSSCCFEGIRKEVLLSGMLKGTKILQGCLSLSAAAFLFHRWCSHVVRRGLSLEFSWVDSKCWVLAGYRFQPGAWVQFFHTQHFWPVHWVLHPSNCCGLWLFPWGHISCGKKHGWRCRNPQLFQAMTIPWSIWAGKQSRNSHDRQPIQVPYWQ